MTVRPGRNLIRIAAVLVLLGLLAFVWGNVLWILGLILIPLAGLAWNDARQAGAILESVDVSRTLPKIIGRDLSFEHVITLRNNGSKLACGTCRDVMPDDCNPIWRDQAFRLAPGTSEAFVTACRIPVRGKHQFGPAWVRVVGPLQLMEVQRAITGTGTVKVLPETFASREELQKDLGAALLMLDKTTRSRQKGVGTEFVSLDAYRRGDDPRRVDWKATARHGFPIIRRYQVERHRDVLILIDCGRLMGAMTDRGSKLDCAVDAALNLARVALQSGDRCGVSVFDSQLRGYLAPSAGGQSLKNMVECVYDLQTQWHETDFSRMFAEVQQRQSKRSLMIVISDLPDAETSRMHCAALARLNRRHLVLFAALRTPLLRRVISSQTDSIEQGARQAVAMGLERDRSRALYALKHGGVHLLDVEPNQLTLPLINQFIDLRRRNLL